MKRYKSNKRIQENKGIKKLWKKIVILGAVGAIAITPVMSEVSQHQKVKAIQENAEKKVPRSFKNIRQEDMGKYLKAEIENLYKTYPEIDEWMYENSSQTEDMEFINEIYRLYKAYMVDKAEKDVDDLEDVTVTTVDHVVASADLIEENENGKTERIKKTYQEQYKEITNSYVAAKEGRSNGAELGKKLYELLAMELGLDSKVATSEEIDEQIQSKGFYYDSDKNVFYTDKGKADLVAKDSNVAEKAIKDVQHESEGFEH